MCLAIIESTRCVRDALQLVIKQRYSIEQFSFINVLADLRQMAASAAPTVVLLDIDFPDEQTWAIINFVMTQLVATQLVLSATRCTAAVVGIVEKCRALGFFDKSTEPLESLPLVLKAAEEKRNYFSASYLETKARFEERARHWHEHLTDRELQTLSLIGQAKDNPSIGRCLGVSPTTAQGYRSSLLRKLGLKNTAQLANYSLQYGFAPVPLPGSNYVSSTNGRLRACPQPTLGRYSCLSRAVHARTIPT